MSPFLQTLEDRHQEVKELPQGQTMVKFQISSYLQIVFWNILWKEIEFLVKEDKEQTLNRKVVK